MIEQYVSINTLMSKIVRDIGPDTHLRYSAIKEWVGEMIQKLAVAPILIRKNDKIDVVNHRAEKPCDLYYTICLTYNDCKLRYGADIRNHTTNRTFGIGTSEEDLSIPESRIFASNYDLIYNFDDDGNLTKTNINPSPVNFMYNVSDDIDVGAPYYYIEGDWYKFSFEATTTDKQVEVDYYAYYTDDNNFPMIPDNTYFMEACHYYVLYKMVGSGHTHPIFKGRQGLFDLKQLWEEQFQRARGTINMPHLEQLNQYYNSYVKLFPNIHELDHYRNNIEAMNNEGYSAGL